MPGYAVQRFFLHVAAYSSGPAFGFAIWSVFRGEFRNAAIWAGVCAICGIYWLAFYEKRDTTARRKSDPG